jgi:polygalacturonase
MRLLCGLVLASLAYSSLAAQAGATACNVRQFGAAGDGKHLDSPAIQQAIQSAGQAGGGTVLVPAGTYLCGSIHLLSNIHLLLDAGAIILAAPQSLAAYDPTEDWHTVAYEDGGHVYFHNSLIWGEDLTNVSITGQGRIEGSRNGEGLVSNDGILDHMCGYFLWNKPGASLPESKPVRLGNKAIALKLCRNVLLRDITILHGGHFAVLVTGCDGLTVDNVTMDTNRDGIDIDCCHNATVANCRINSPNDDGLCLKSTYALNRVVLTENVTIVKCQVSGFAEGSLWDGTMQPSKLKTGRIKFGTESTGGFRNCSVSNCTFRSCRGLALEEVDGGSMENITIDNLAMQDVFTYAIYLTIGKRDRTPNSTATSRMRNISISNVTATGVDSMSGIQVMGLPEQPIEDIRLSNISLACDGGGSREDAARVVPELGAGYPEASYLGRLSAYGVFARHVRGLQLAGITISTQAPEQRPAILCEDVDGLDILGFEAPVVPGVPVAKFTGVENLRITAAPALAGIAATNP